MTEARVSVAPHSLAIVIAMRCASRLHAVVSDASRIRSKRPIGDNWLSMACAFVRWSGWFGTGRAGAAGAYKA